MKNNILVSIIIPVYNGSNYISNAIKSAQEQSYKNIEIIVVNDGSNDNSKTENCVSNFLSDNRIKYYYKNNGGVASALNFGISKSSGYYICWLSHDDMFPPNKIKKQVEYLQKNSKKSNEKIIIYSKSVLIDENGKRWPFYKQWMYHTPNITYKKPLDFFKIKHVFYGSLLLPACFLKNHPFLNDLKYSQDTFSYFQMLENEYRLLYCGSSFTYYRVHSEQGSFSRASEYEDDVFVMHNYFMRYFIKNNDFGFLKAYVFYLSKKCSTSNSIKKILNDFFNDRKKYKLNIFTIIKSKILIFVYDILYTIKIKFFGR